MNNFTQEEKEYVRHLLEDKSTKYNILQILKKHNPTFLEKVLNETSFLSDTVKISERLYCILNNITSIVLCEQCHLKPVRFSSTRGYYKYCSISCGSKAQLIRQGGIHFDKEKTRKTRIAKYGSFHPSDFGKKTKETKLKNHGFENFVNSEKAKQTKKERYGNENFTNHEQMLKTKEERYGDKYYNNSNKISETKCSFSKEKIESINEKRLNTVKEKYGVENVTQLQNIKDKIKNSCIEKYGVSTSLMLPISRNKSKRIIKDKAYHHMLNTPSEYEPLFSYDEFMESDLKKTYLKWRHKKCGNIVYGRYTTGKILAHCRECYPYSSSISEKELLEFIKSIYKGEIIENTRLVINPKELDIYIPEKRLAIEFDGLYWHSEDSGTDRDALLSKTIDCQKNNIQLVHVFEDEWIHKKEIVKSRISNLLGLSKRIYARQCELKIIEHIESKNFLEENHIQGSCASKIRLGLYYNGELVSLMTFGKARFSKTSDWELLRFCNKINTTVIGGASKLLCYFEKMFFPKEIISYADRRWSNGNLYQRLGFEKLRESPPNYWYLGNESIRLSRLVYQKHNLPKLLKSFDPSKSEVENMRANGYNRIFDCGNLVYVKEF